MIYHEPKLELFIMLFFMEKEKPKLKAGLVVVQKEKSKAVVMEKAKTEFLLFCC
jgi:hypothetical protein